MKVFLAVWLVLGCVMCADAKRRKGSTRKPAKKIRYIMYFNRDVGNSLTLYYGDTNAKIHALAPRKLLYCGKFTNTENPVFIFKYWYFDSPNILVNRTYRLTHGCAVYLFYKLYRFTVEPTRFKLTPIKDPSDNQKYISE